MTFVALGLATLVLGWLLRVVWVARHKRAQLVDLVAALMGEALGATHWERCAEFARDDLETWTGLLNVLALGKRLPEPELRELRARTAAASSGETAAREALVSFISALPELPWVDPLDAVLGQSAPKARAIVTEVVNEQLGRKP